MHGRTFKALKGGEIVTIWGRSPSRGCSGIILEKDGDGRNNLGRVTIRLGDGLTVVENYAKVCIGDNSKFIDDE